MILNEVTGDVTAPTIGIIGHGVNCQGVMGSGVALTIRKKFPAAYQAYLDLCARTTQLVEISPMLYIANMFTQFNYGADGQAYASIQAVREACAHLHILRGQLIDKLYAAEAELLEQYVANLFDSPLKVDLLPKSERTKTVKVCIHGILGAMTNADQTDGDRPYILPIHLPLIGCGLGGLKWETTRPSIDSHTGRAPVTIYHYSK